MLKSAQATAKSSLRLATAGFMVACLANGCASWEDEVVFPENFRDSYTKVAGCSKSAHPAAEYVETWLSPEGKDAWDALVVQLADEDTTTTAVFPEGSIFVKVQFDDSACEELANYTAMKKLAPDTAPDLGDWKWQYVGDDGECNTCNAGQGCAGCHSPCKPAPYMCTNPNKK